MFTFLILGIGYGFAAAVQPGPFSTYLISETLRKGWRRTLPAIFSPLLSDGPIATIAILALSTMPVSWLRWLRLVGGVFLLYLGYGAWKAWRAYREPDVRDLAPSRVTVLKAATVNWLNPNPYVAWSLVLGPLLLKGWHESPGRAFAMLGGFYATIILTFAVIILVFHYARNVGPRLTRTLIGCSALALAAFGFYQLGIAVLRTP